MAFDGLVIRALAQELHKKLKNARLDKIYQPETDELLLALHGPEGAYKVTLSANASIPRVALCESTKENPAKAPMFCMLLRKHLGAAHVIAVRQPQLERMLFFDFETRNELGDLVRKSLVVEMMGRHSNIIFIDEHGRVADSIKRIDFSISSKRQILPGLPYEMPPTQNKLNPLDCSLEDFLEVLSGPREADTVSRLIVGRFQGVSPLVARELVFRAFGETDRPCQALDYAQCLDLATAMHQLFAEVNRGDFTPCMLTDAETGRLMEFSAVSITQYGSAAFCSPESSMGYLIEQFYRARDKKERMLRRGANLAKTVSVNLERCAKKLQLQAAELSDTEKREEWRQFGELITANMYQMEKGLKSIRVQNYFDESLPMVVIPLDETLSPSANAQRYYKKYNKAKTAREELLKQMKLAKEELSYLESVEEALLRAETDADLSQIGDELAAQGYLRRPKEMRRKKENPAAPAAFTTKDGFSILAGRNNRQNDYLTCKLAHGRDLWFHAKNIPGSHVVLCYDPDRPFTEAAITEAAALAAQLSKAREAEKVPVDYTEIKNVKKPAGAKPGFVIYTTNKTAYVTPSGLRQTE
ncbi:MAG: fibronectin/fibrinogen-binding protein [Ruminococcaceae bacterium]|nr:fibronectin/fibrinogen-binding protein [Oscillospiraceae bacterium]